MPIPSTSSSSSHCLRPAGWPDRGLRRDVVADCGGGPSPVSESRLAEGAALPYSLVRYRGRSTPNNACMAIHRMFNAALTSLSRGSRRGSQCSVRDDKLERDTSRHVTTHVAPTQRTAPVPQHAAVITPREAPHLLDGVSFLGVWRLRTCRKGTAEHTRHAPRQMQMFRRRRNVVTRKLHINGREHHRSRQGAQWK